MIEFFAGQTADGQSGTKVWPGGKGSFVAYGTWGSGTIKLQLSPDGGTTWIDVTGVSLTANGHKDVPVMGPGLQFRADLSGSTGANLSAKLF